MSNWDTSWIVAIVLGSALVLLVIGIIVWTLVYQRKHHVSSDEEPSLEIYDADDRWDKLLQSIEHEKRMKAEGKIRA